MVGGKGGGRTDPEGRCKRLARTTRSASASTVGRLSSPPPPRPLELASRPPPPSVTRATVRRGKLHVDPATSRSSGTTVVGGGNGEKDVGEGDATGEIGGGDGAVEIGGRGGELAEDTGGSGMCQRRRKRYQERCATAASSNLAVLPPHYHRPQRGHRQSPELAPPPPPLPATRASSPERGDVDVKEGMEEEGRGEKCDGDGTVLILQNFSGTQPISRIVVMFF
uniref:Uncharacterized protein n=1 Tax=Oryza punctata TaxID=4537 RepID=A0A0E0JLY0_ORYPU